MKKYVVLAALMGMLTACSQKTAVAPDQTNAAAIQLAVKPQEQPTQLSATNATLFGPIADDDWYMIATGAPGVKPLVIWVPSKANCDSSAAEFNLKSVDPQHPDDPAKAWCAMGRELRVKYGIH